MPTYDYRCDACGHEMDKFQGITEPALKKCPACGKPKLRRLIGSGAGIIFKGSGFYETDYKRSRPSTSKEGSPRKDGESKPSKPADSSSSSSAPSTPTPASDSKPKKSG